ncbi:hypothetical protein WK59_12075 [Burkholderia ubonensis]|uniref:hypothetical protein n=1 Tax=Burkholderia ubonensis TaxID=101571 RepID=UPI00075B5A9A|nr:hypothetical protein [Burkholderia ubonensis]KVT85700.1 hypothetical protein WK59_12075 [Burkholderia ubonensis]
MRKVHGFVLSKQGAKPLPNLVVAFFDSDIEPSALTRELEQHAEGTRSGSWALFGKALGSVLTDDVGRFELDFGDAKHEGECREHVLLVVFAPDDVASPEHPFPLPPEKRILFASNLPDQHAGAQAHVIRLLPAQLEKFGIAPAGATPTSEPALDPTSRHYVDSIERSFVFKDNVKQLVKPRIEAQVAQATAVKNAAKKKFKNLNAIRAENRKHPQLLTDPAKLPEMMRTTAAAGISKLSATPRSLSLSLTEDEITSLGLNVDAHGKVSGKVDARTFSKFLAARNGGVDLVSRRSAAIDPASLVGSYTAPTSRGRKSS